MIQAKDNPGCFAAILRLFGIKPAPKKYQSTTYPGQEDLLDLPYRVRDDFLSPAELSFYHVLSNAAQSQAVIFPKVRLADIFFVANPNENFSYFNRISAKHIDFLLCLPGSLKPIAGIELDDESHTRSSREERDAFVEEVFESADLPLLRFPNRYTYPIDEIKAKVAPLFQVEKSLLNNQTQWEASKTSTTPTVPYCPKCGIPMVLRTATQGVHKGKQFYGCPNYPKCREMEKYPYIEIAKTTERIQ